MKHVKAYNLFESENSKFENIEDYFLEFIDDGKCYLSNDDCVFKSYSFRNSEDLEKVVDKLRKIGFTNLFHEHNFLFLLAQRAMSAYVAAKSYLINAEFEKNDREFIWRVRGSAPSRGGILLSKDLKTSEFYVRNELRRLFTSITTYRQLCFYSIANIGKSIGIFVGYEGFSPTTYIDM